MAKSSITAEASFQQSRAASTKGQSKWELPTSLPSDFICFLKVHRDKPQNSLAHADQTTFS